MGNPSPLSFETVHPSDGIDIIVTVSSDMKLESVTDQEKYDVVLYPADVDALQKEAVNHFLLN